MINPKGWFYLHADGSLRFKSDSERAVVSMIADPQAKAYWVWTPRHREVAWTILVEALAGGANKEQVLAMAEKAGCTDEDAPTFAERMNCRLTICGNHWWATRRDWNPDGPSGTGETALEAMADLCKAMGYGPTKLLPKTFVQLLNQEALKKVKSMEGWYYLHTNGELIYKPELGETAADIRESDFARALWPVNVSDREGAWNIIVEALAAGAIKERVLELAEKWKCGNDDALEYAERIGVQLTIDGDQWLATRSDFINLQESPVGYGATALEAMAALCKELGYMPTKMWGSTFKDLLKVS